MKRIPVLTTLTALLALWTVAAFGLVPSEALGAVPQLINFQGILRDGSGNPVANGVYTVRFRIYDDSTAGSILWEETVPVSTTSGLFSVRMGDGTALPNDLFSTGANRFVGIRVNLDPEMAPRTRLISVSYTFQSLRSDSALTAMVALDLTCSGCVSGSEVDATQVQLRVTGTAPGGQYVTGINQNGTVVTAPDANNAYTAGTGLVLNGTQFAIPPDGVTSTEIANDAVGSTEIAAGAVAGGLGGDVADGTLTADDLGTNSVGSAEIATGAVGSGEIAVDAVGAAAIALGAVGASEVADNSLFGTDIADGTIGAADLGTNSVAADEIATGAVGTGEVADGSLLAADISDEPGVASTIGTSFGSLDGTIQTLLSRSITTPAAGYVLVIGTAEVQINHTNGATNTATFGVSDLVGSFPVNQDMFVQIPSSAPSGTYWQIVTAHGLFSVGAFALNFYFVARDDLSGALGNFSVQDAQLTLVYFPTAYGTVVPTVASAIENLPNEKVQSVSALLPESTTELAAAQTPDPVALQRELAQVKAEMEARMKRLEEQLQQNQKTVENQP